MARRAIVVNSKSTGKFWEQIINNRPHLVTSMVSIECNSIMNSLFYPTAAVMEAYPQLDRLPAPLAHPRVDGELVSASNPLAANVHNVGGLVMNPRVSGSQIINDLAIDIAVAEKDERGIEVMTKIRNSEQFGVSTGLGADVIDAPGVHAGRPYSGVVANIEFDHVAMLPGAVPAGDNTYTINSADTDKTLICNLDVSLNELREKVSDAARVKFPITGTGNGYVYVLDILLDPPRAIIEFNDTLNDHMLEIPYAMDATGAIVFVGDGVIVERNVTFDPVVNNDKTAPEGVQMDIKQFLLAIIANSANSFGLPDLPALEAMSAEALATALSKTPTIEQATAQVQAAGLVVNNAEVDTEGYAAYVANKEAFDVFQAAAVEKRKTIVAHIVANSKTTEADVVDMADDALERLSNSIAPGQDFSAGAADISNANNAEAEVDYSD